MPGKRLKDPALTRTNFSEAVANGAELLTDWEGLVWARPIPITLIGNAWWQGSYDSATWSNTIEDDHAYVRVSTDGGITWLVFKMSDCDGSGGDQHPPVTIGVPDGGLVISGDDTQILTLNPATGTNPGSMSSEHFIKVTNLKFDYIDNVGAGSEIFKEYIDSGDNRTHYLRTLVAGVGVTLTQGTDTITIDATGAGGGETNLMSNVGTDGVGVYYQKNGVEFEMRNIASQTDIITITLDELTEGHQDIDINIIESNIDHDVLENFVPDEHIDHSTVSILTEEGITGGGDLTATRTLTLAFDELTLKTSVANTDLFAFYRPGDDLHYSIAYSDMKVWIKNHTDIYYVPLTTGVYTLTGLSGGGVLNVDRYIGLAFNNLPTVAYNPADYVPIYDVSGATHAKVTLADMIGQLAVNISAGDGMNFSTITSTGTVTLGTPSTINETSTNIASGTTHTHAFDMSTFELTDLGDVIDTPITNYYLQWNGTTWVTSDPAIGASSPGDPLYSVQFNRNGSFGGSYGLTYYEDFGRLNLVNTGLTTHGINFDTFINSTVVTLTGTSGTANITGVGGLTKLVTFATNLETTANNFVTAFATDYLAQDIIVTANNGVLTFTGEDNTPVTTAIITNATGNLSGTVTSTLTQNGAEIYLDSTAPLVRKLVFKNIDSGADTIELLSNRVFIGAESPNAGDFVYIQDPNTSQFSNTLNIFNILDDNLLRLTNTGSLYLPKTTSSVTTNVLYFNPSTGLVTYGAISSGGGGISTLIADSLSGLMVNGGSISSASIIELDQNDNKLVVATPLSNDYIGFYDVSTGLQSKALLSSLPGWNAYLNGVLQEEIKPGDTFNFEAGTGMTITYNTTTNTLKFDSSAVSGDPLDWIEFEFGDFTAGTDREYTLDIKALVDYTILSIILEVDGGTFTDVDLKINGVDVTGCVSMTATTYPSYTEYTATANNSVVEGDRIVMTLGTTYTGTPTFIRGKLNIQRV